jgi:hypothetical protein
VLQLNKELVSKNGALVVFELQEPPYPQLLFKDEIDGIVFGSGSGSRWKRATFLTLSSTQCLLVNLEMLSLDPLDLKLIKTYYNAPVLNWDVTKYTLTFSFLTNRCPPHITHLTLKTNDTCSILIL